MKISVIVPVYNTEKYLCDCVESILAQTLTDIEIILVNDGSVDSSAEIINDYVQRYPGKIFALHLENGGQGRARNHGIEIARGDYLSFIDSDDYLHPKAFELMYTSAVLNDADVVVCDMEKRYDDGKSEYIKAAIQDAPLASAGSSSNKIFRRDRVGDIRFPQGLWYEDFSFSAKLLLVSRNTVFVNEALYIYRCGQNSTMNNNNSLKNLDILDIMRDISSFAYKYEFRNEFEFLLINHVLLDSIKRVAMQNSPEKKNVIKKLRTYVRENIPNLSDCESFRKESRNRRLIMWLNYHGFEKISLLLLRLK